MAHDPRFGDAEGPLGFPMPSAQARQLDAIIRSLPHDPAHEYRKRSLTGAITQLQPGERADVSWISREEVDREGDLIRAVGMDDSQFESNPIVTLNHAYWLPPVGLSLWRRAVREEGAVGIVAKTYYPVRPASWAESTWSPDECLALVQSGLLRGKSIGFLPLKARAPTDEEVRTTPALGKVRYIIEKWLLLEYACCYLPVQPFAVVEAVSKGTLPGLSAPIQKALGIEPPIAAPATSDLEPYLAALGRIDWAHLTISSIHRAVDRLRGRIS